MLVEVSDKGRITLPAEIRNKLGITIGSLVCFSLEGETICLKPVRPGFRVLEGEAES